jgi:hypothetical protein
MDNEIVLQIFASWTVDFGTYAYIMCYHSEVLQP